MSGESRLVPSWMPAACVALAAAAAILAVLPGAPPRGESPDAHRAGSEDEVVAVRSDIPFAAAEGRVVREEDAPAPGVEILVGDANLPMWEIFSEAESDEEGRFRIRYPTDRDWRLQVNCEFAEIEGREALEAYDPNRNLFRVPDPRRPLRVRVTNMQGFSHLRCVDRSTGKVLRGTVRSEFATLPRGPFDQHSEYTPRHGGWIPVVEDCFPHPVDLIGPPGATEVRISQPGYSAVTRPYNELRGWVTLRLDPVVPDAKPGGPR